MKKGNLKTNLLVAGMLLLMTAGIMYQAHAADTHAVPMANTLTNDPWQWSTDSLEGVDTQSTGWWSDTAHVPGMFTDGIIEFDWIDADTALEYFFAAGSISVYIDIYAGRSEGVLTRLDHDSLGSLADYYKFVDLVWLKSDPDDSLWGPWYTSNVWVKHWHTNDTAWFADDWTKDSLMYGLALSMWDSPR